MFESATRTVEEALPLAHVTYHVLLALATDRRHGYGIIQHVAERTGGGVRLEAGSLYAAIKRMKDDSWIEETPNATGTDARRRTYIATELGRQILVAECRRLDAMLELARKARVFSRSRTVKA